MQGKQSAPDIAAPPPLGLYVHLPWCVRKCPYCDFNSHEAPSLLDEPRYVAALLADLDREAPLVEGRELSSLFIGGGTPSLFSATGIDALLRGVVERIPCEEAMEVTLEANPGTREAGRYAAYREAGVNRLSIGVQSFSAAALRALGRIHDPDQAVAAAEEARRAGFDNINLDLMFGLPAQSIEEGLQDLHSATELAPAHISYYQLTLEPNTLFHHQPPELPGEEAIAEIQAGGQDLLAAEGYGQYEVSAYARAGKRCRHNLNYWTFGDYIGIGAGAHGKLTLPGGIRRRWKVRDPHVYMARALAGSPIAGERLLTEVDLMLEFMMNALRLREGVATGLFQQRTGLSMDILLPLLEEPGRRGLLEVVAGEIRATPLGWRFLDDLVACFCPG